MPDDLSSPSTPNNTDPHMGLLLSKDGPTPDCSAAGADITNVKGIKLSELGFDINNGTHCGAGAPRFNVVTSDNVLHFLGCSAGTKTFAPQDPTAWARVRIDPSNPAQAFPTPVLPSTTIVSISIIFDEGTDTSPPVPPSGLAVIDNIDINKTLVGAGKSDSVKSDGGKPKKEGD